MSKNKEELARLSGMNFALKYVKDYGIEALESEVKRRGAFNIPLSVGQKELSQFCENVKNMTCDTILILAMVTLHDEFGFGPKRLQQFQDRFDFKTSCLTDDFTTWQEQIDILKEECGIELAIRENNSNVRIKSN